MKFQGVYRYGPDSTMASNSRPQYWTGPPAFWRHYYMHWHTWATSQWTSRRCDLRKTLPASNRMECSLICRIWLFRTTSIRESQFLSRQRALHTACLSLSPMLPRPGRWPLFCVIGGISWLLINGIILMTIPPGYRLWHKVRAKKLKVRDVLFPAILSSAQKWQVI